ncbi:tetratricopeptide repeat-containing protein [Streptomyces sp. CMB-StM0423]|uniref:tetratricopeptide repeat-containing protein n=1 Tax=Streptomyces sp. CMB-StM0423 TaxID=2059884 RepID=UPI000C706CA4|nr:tetratricopeptide repeat-containing protein [Streptomyces sp. CMB-StM0423]AUH40266.1 tetratricopeptide repeat-containing protein [Streptomyces sp. CMB-StM0423]
MSTDAPAPSPAGPPADIFAFRQAMHDNAQEPEGPGRNAGAERLLAEAERSGEAAFVVEGLIHLLQTYNFSSEQDKMFVPFARLLRMWDERPEDFDEEDTHRLFWMFKWVSSGMTDQPHIPLAAMEKWLGEMERRYRLAGHSERAVRQAEYHIAEHVGDDARAARAYAAWRAAERDATSDCHACELRGQGSWEAGHGDDDAALELWAPVLGGVHTCAHEPHATLAESLLPLLRLGRVDEARSNHLRGHRMVRRMESMRFAFARHVEFCALTGNEARGLELLAERPAYLADRGEPSSLMAYLAVTALLTRRLAGLGLGAEPVVGPPEAGGAGREWTVAELGAYAEREALALAGRFDARNGTAAVSAGVRERMAREPLAERLPLGLRVGRPVRRSAPPAAPAAGAAAPPAAGAPAARPGVAELLASARELTEARRPDAVRAWADAARAAVQAGTELPVRDRAEVAAHRAMHPDTADGEVAALFGTAAGLFETAGDPGQAEVARARAAFALAREGRTDDALAAVAEPCARALALHAEGRATAAEAATALICRARIHTMRGDGASGTADSAEAVAAVADFAAPYADDPRVAGRIAEAYELQAELAARRGEREAAAALYEQAVDGYAAAGVPWYAVRAQSALGGIASRLGDRGTAERAVRGALEHSAVHAQPAGQAGLHLQLADVLCNTGRDGEGAEHLLEAALWADEAGDSADTGAWARHHLGGALLRLGRAAEAAAVLEDALADLSADQHGEGAVVQTRWWLGDALGRLGEHKQAAEQYVLAAGIAAHWPRDGARDHAMLATLAAQSLSAGELDTQAARAYERAGALWRDLGDVPAVIRTLRARAWLALRPEQAGTAAGRALMAEAERELTAALATTAGSGGQDTAEPGGTQVRGGRRDVLLAELAATHRQTGDLITAAVGSTPHDPDESAAGAARTAYEEGLAHVVRAVTGFAELGPDCRDEYTGAQLLAAWLEADLGRPGAAARRARAVLAAYADDDTATETSESRRDEAQALLNYAGTEAAGS